MPSSTPFGSTSNPSPNPEIQAGAWLASFEEQDEQNLMRTAETLNQHFSFGIGTTDHYAEASYSTLRSLKFGD